MTPRQPQAPSARRVSRRFWRFVVGRLSDQAVRGFLGRAAGMHPFELTPEDVDWCRDALADLFAGLQHFQGEEEDT